MELANKEVRQQGNTSDWSYFTRPRLACAMGGNVCRELHWYTMFRAGPELKLQRHRIVSRANSLRWRTVAFNATRNRFGEH
jgi:hypothetical protein